jgi:hypothetical protein
MREINPYEAPRTDVGRRWARGSFNMLRRVARVALLAIIGYGVYFGSVFVAALVSDSVSITDASWAWGGVMAFAFAASELFGVAACSLNRSQLRRLIVSGALTIVSLLISGPLCILIGLEIRYLRTPLLLPRVIVGLPVFIALTLTFRRALQSLSKAPPV